MHNDDIEMVSPFTPAKPKDAKEVCVTCGIPTVTHLGKVGQGNCFGSAVTKVFSELLQLVHSLRHDLEEERREARDREHRLHRKVADLSKKLEVAEDHAAEMSAKLDKVATALESSKNVALDSSKNVHVQNAHRLKKNSMISRQLRVTDDQAPGTSAAPTSQQSSSSSNARLEISGQDVLDEMTSTDVTKNRTQDNADMTQYAQRERRPTTTLPCLPG